MFEILLMVLLILLLIAVMILTMYVFTKLIDFEIDHVNPIDLCSTIEKLVKPFILMEGACVLITLIEIRHCYLILLLTGSIFGYTIFLKNKKHRIFEPMTIVRDMGKTKGQIIIVMIATGLSFIIGLVQSLYIAFS